MYITRHTKYFSVKVYARCLNHKRMFVMMHIYGGLSHLLGIVVRFSATKSCRGNRVTASESPQDRGLHISIVIHDPSYATGLSLRYRKQDAWILS